MNVLMLGLGSKPGSFDIRGKQLGAAIGARVTSTPTADDWRWAELAIIVKRSEPHFGPAARAAGVPIVWDALDCWRQPAENGVTEGQARQGLRAHQAVIRPTLTIGATEAQASAAGGVYLPHHSWPGLTPAPVREQVQTVAYQGNAAYLGRWLERISHACGRRGWRFVVNPPDLREADLIVALRDGPWDGWICREWKSGVKLVNAIAAGRPVITQQTAAWREIQPPGSAIESANDFDLACDVWADPVRRAEAAVGAADRAPQYTLAAIATQYQTLLHTTLSEVLA